METVKGFSLEIQPRWFRAHWQDAILLEGKKFDYDLKHLRLLGDLLMELGAGMELATAVAPHLFLPFACAANVAKRVWILGFREYEIFLDF
ncbi:protein root UVB sensitive 6 [Artemisia annua]|uniref:Protein root UVB sensitive 6 n=1 Tax=Artemisia annua TaxID=35608 RepID=A0A2U1MT85_ARTAN|nr:protein root UVB sensitive 6 [Artemisia annua]